MIGAGMSFSARVRRVDDRSPPVPRSTLRGRKPLANPLLDDGIEPSLAHCLAERIVVALGLIGVCDGKISDGLIEAARPRIQCRAAPKAASARTAAVRFRRFSGGGTRNAEGHYRSRPIFDA